MIIETIYVLPTEENIPPRAILGSLDEEESTITGVQVLWSNDIGTWATPDGLPVPPELAEMITGHAKSLGVEW